MYAFLPLNVPSDLRLTLRMHDARSYSSSSNLQQYIQLYSTTKHDSKNKSKKNKNTNKINKQAN